MCISPVRIRNPNKGSKFSSSFIKDTVSAFINVPCGHCPECISLRQSYVVQRCQAMLFDNYMFFATLTYNNQSLPVLTTSTGYDIRYADIHDLQCTFKRLRKSNAFTRPFKYYAVSELGSLRGRPHFHALLFLPRYESDNEYTPLNLERILFDSLLLEWRRNYGSSRKPVYKPLCTYKAKMICGKLRSNYDLHFVRSNSSVEGESDVAFYVSKYLFKPSGHAVDLQRALRLNLPEDEYEHVWSKVRPRDFVSNGFGLGLNADNYVRSCVSRSKSVSDFPLWYNPISGKPSPLSRFYRSKGFLFSQSDYLDFYFGSDAPADNVVFHKDIIVDKFDRAISKHNKKVQSISDSDESCFLNLLN